MTQLIMLDTPIIVSNEEISKNSIPCYCYNSIKNTWNNDIILFQGKMPMYHYKGFKKIIAGIEGLPSINWNGLEEEFGWIDVEELAKEATNKQMIRLFGNESKEEIEDDIQKRKYYFKEGFKKALSLNEKKFSLEDMVNFLDFVIIRYPNQWKAYTARISKGFYSSSEILHEFIQSQQPKVFDIEVEMYRPNEAYQISEHWSPKITNNSIKIIKKL